MVQIKLDASIQLQRPEVLPLLKNWNLEISVNSSYTLGFDSAFWIQDSEGRKLKIDFDENKRDYQRTHKGSGESLARGLGFKDGIRSVIDLTAGLGIDSVFLAQLGFKVFAVERNPYVAFLLSMAQQQSQREEIKQIQFVFASSEEFLQNFKFQEPISAYFDPMYPDKKKSALPRQEMVIFREMVGGDTDSGQLLDLALQKPFHKIVVKRPVKAEPVIAKPSYELTSKLVRYDVYYPRSSS